MELITAILISVLFILLYLKIDKIEKREHYTVEERLAILEKRVDDLYSGGADARHRTSFSSTNQ